MQVHTSRCSGIIFSQSQAWQLPQRALFVCRLPVEFDPLNVPEDLREERASMRADGVSAGPSPEPSCNGSEAPRPLSRQSSHGIMLALPEKLRMHAEHAQHLADNALNSFVIINTALQRSAALAQYVQRKDVQARMGSAFRVGMGFGLHAGCAFVAAQLLLFNAHPQFVAG